MTAELGLAGVDRANGRDVPGYRDGNAGARLGQMRCVVLVVQDGVAQ